MSANAGPNIANLLKVLQTAVDPVLVVYKVPAATITTFDEACVAGENAIASFQVGNDTAATVENALNAALAATASLQGIIPPQAEALISLAVIAADTGIGIWEASHTVDPTAHDAKVTALVAKVQTARPGFQFSKYDKLRTHVNSHVVADHFTGEWEKTIKETGLTQFALKK